MPLMASTEHHWISKSVFSTTLIISISHLQPLNNTQISPEHMGREEIFLMSYEMVKSKIKTPSGSK